MCNVGVRLINKINGDVYVNVDTCLFSRIKIIIRVPVKNFLNGNNSLKASKQTICEQVSKIRCFNKVQVLMGTHYSRSVTQF